MRHTGSLRLRFSDVEQRFNLQSLVAIRTVCVIGMASTVGTLNRGNATVFLKLRHMTPFGSMLRLHQKHLPSIDADRDGTKQNDANHEQLFSIWQV